MHHIFFLSSILNLRVLKIGMNIADGLNVSRLKVRLGWLLELTWKCTPLGYLGGMLWKV